MTLSAVSLPVWFACGRRRDLSTGQRIRKAEGGHDGREVMSPCRGDLQSLRDRDLDAVLLLYSPKITERRRKTARAIRSMMGFLSAPDDMA